MEPDPRVLLGKMNVLNLMHPVNVLKPLKLCQILMFFHPCYNICIFITSNLSDTHSVTHKHILLTYNSCSKYAIYSMQLFKKKNERLYTGQNTSPSPPRYFPVQILEYKIMDSNCQFTQQPESPWEILPMLFFWNPWYISFPLLGLSAPLTLHHRDQ